MAGDTYLNPGLGEVESHRQFLPGEYVRVLRLLEGPLQLVQLIGGEGGPAPADLPGLCLGEIVSGLALFRVHGQVEVPGGARPSVPAALALCNGNAANQ